MVCCIVDSSVENCAAMIEAVAVAKDCDIEAGTVVTDGAGLVVTAEEDQILDDALETADEVVVVVTDVDGVVDILTHSTEKSSRLRTAVA